MDGHRPRGILSVAVPWPACPTVCLADVALSVHDCLCGSANDVLCSVTASPPRQVRLLPVRQVEPGPL